MVVARARKNPAVVAGQALAFTLASYHQIYRSDPEFSPIISIDGEVSGDRDQIVHGPIVVHVGHDQATFRFLWRWNFELDYNWLGLDRLRRDSRYERDQKCHRSDNYAELQHDGPPLRSIGFGIKVHRLAHEHLFFE